MSDPTWASRTIIDGAAGTLYVQAAGVTAAPGTANEVGFATGFSLEASQTTTTKGPYINYGTKKTSRSGIEVSGEFAVDMAAGADANYAMLVNSVGAGTRLKVTFDMDDGPTYAVDQALFGFSVENSPEDGTTTTFPFTADSYTFTAAT